MFDEEKGAAEATPRETVSKLAIGWRDLRAVRSKPNPVRPQVHTPPREQFRCGTEAGVRRGLRGWRVPEF